MRPLRHSRIRRAAGLVAHPRATRSVVAWLALAAAGAAHAQPPAQPRARAAAGAAAATTPVARDADATAPVTPAADVIPIAPLTGRWATLRHLPTDRRDRWALQEDVEAGRVDPPALVAHVARALGTPTLPIPSGARYDRECSRRFGPGTAVFTFGLEMNPAARAHIERRIATAGQRRSGQREMEALNEQQRLLESGEQGAIVARMEALLRQRGYALSHNPGDHLVGSNVWHRVTPAGRVPPDVTVLALMVHPQCLGRLPTGPALLLSVDR